MKAASIRPRAPASSSRRSFLTATAAIGGGLLLGFAVPARSEIRDTLTTDAPFAPNAFLRIDRARQGAHATMEPMNCTVLMTKDGCDVWVGTQVPGLTQSAVM